MLYNIPRYLHIQKNKFLIPIFSPVVFKINYKVFNNKMSCLYNLREINKNTM